MLESGPDEPQAWRYSCCQMTRVSKIEVFRNLNPSPNCEIGSVFGNSKCYLDRLSMLFTKMQSKSDFLKFHFSRFFKRISGFWPVKKKSPI